eukprot:309511-Pyramimonas_sp.AAC.1
MVPKLLLLCCRVVVLLCCCAVEYSLYLRRSPCKVIEGYEEVVKKIEEVGSGSGSTSKDVVIEDCGEL